MIYILQISISAQVHINLSSQLPARFATDSLCGVDGNVQGQPRASWGAVNSPVNSLCTPCRAGSWEKRSNMCHLQAYSHRRLTKCFLAAIQGKGPGYCLTHLSVLSGLTPASHRRLVPKITLSCFPGINLPGSLVLSTHTRGGSLQKNPASISVWMWFLAEMGG